MAKSFFDFAKEVSDQNGGELFKAFCECKNKKDIKRLLDWGINPDWQNPDEDNGYWKFHEKPDINDPDNVDKGIPLDECDTLLDMKDYTGLSKWPPPPAY